MVDLANTTSGITRLKKQNYRSWRSCIKSYLEGQDLWEVINGNDTIPPNNPYTLPIWKVKAGKVMYVLKSTIEDELLQKIKDDNTPKMAWDTLASLFPNTNDGFTAEEMNRATIMDPKLYKAAKEGDVKHLEAAILQRNRSDEFFLRVTKQGDNNILHIAARAGRDKFIAKALEYFPSLFDKPNSKGDTPLLVAARFGHLRVVGELTRSATVNETNPTSSQRTEEGDRKGRTRWGARGVFSLCTLPNFRHIFSTLLDFFVKLLKSGLRKLGENCNPASATGDWIVEHQREHSTIPDTAVIDVLSGEGPVHLQLDMLIPNHWRVTNSQGTTVTTALHEALRNGHDDVALHLLRFKHLQAAFYNLAGESPLFLAAESCCEKFMTDVLQEGRSHSTKGPNELNALHAARDCSGAIISLLIERNPHLLTKFDNRGKAPIHHAVEADYESLLDQILKSDPSIALLPDADGYTPLLTASIRGRWEFFMKILEACPESIEARDREGRNALHLCRFENSYRLGLKFVGIPEIWELLNVGDDEGNTPLHLAVRRHQYKKAILLTSSVSINLGAVNKEGRTALDLCESEWMQLDKKRLMWIHLSKRHAPRGRRPNEHKVPVGGPKGIIRSRKEDRERFSQTMSLAAALIATLTFAAALTMPGGYDDLGGATPLKKVPLVIFIFSDTLAMCCSITVLSLIWRAMSVGEDLKVVLNNTSVVLLRIALYATWVAFGSGVFALIAPKVLWVAILVCVICAMVSCLFWPDRVQRSALSTMLVKTWIQIKRCLPCVQSLISWWIKIKWCQLPCVRFPKSWCIKIMRGLCCVQSRNRRGSPATTCC